MERPDSTTFVTIPEASRKTGLGLRQFRRAVLSGELPIYDVGDWPRVRWSEVVEWIEATKRPVADGSKARGREAERDGTP